MAGFGKPGRPRKPVEQHIADGTYRADRHGPLSDGILHYRKKPAAIVTASARSQERWIRNESDRRAVRAGFRFNEGLAAHAAEFFPEYLCHSVGQWYGKPFELADWQRDELIYPLFGWVGPNGLRRFRYTYIEIPKKQGKSTTASGIGLYMLLADEEPGAQIYSLGAVEDQARIVHNEAINMLEASTALDNVVKINRTTGAIAYRSMHAFYKVLSASPRGKHGINIHLGVADELHEWYGDTLWNSIRYGYRARRQPLQLVITNAGNDQESVCYRQRQKAEAVLSGAQEDHRFFALLYGTTQPEAEAEIEEVRKGATILPVARGCNPGLGTLVQEDTLVQDIKDAIHDPSEVRNLLRLTYSVWIVGANPYLDAGKWAECADDFTATDLTGMPCGGAIDASACDDLTAIALDFPSDEDDAEDRTHRQLTWHFMPDETAEKRSHLIDYWSWERDGWLTILPDTPVIDMAVIRAKILELSKRFDARLWFYDPMYFESDAQLLREDENLPMEKFPQTIMHFAGPTRKYKHLVNSGRFRHNGNALLTWQAGHCETKRDVNSNERPIKPEPNSIKKVDGIVSGIMALEAADRMPSWTSAYDKRGMMYANEV